MEDLTEGTLADLMTLGSHPPRLRRMNTQLVKPAPPAAGSNYPYKVDGAWWERILAVTFQFTASATAAQRTLSVVYADADGFTFDVVPVSTAVLAGQTVTCYADQQGPNDIQDPAGLSNTGSVTSPAAGAAIAALSNVQPGNYLAEWSVGLSGTLAAPADVNNFEITAGGVVAAVSENPATAGVYPQQPTRVQVTSAATVQVQAVAAGTLSSVYSASLTLIPQDPAIVQAQIPDLTLKSTWGLTITVGNGQTGDQISQIGILTERYPSNWADGTLGYDEESERRAIIRLLEGRA